MPIFEFKCSECDSIWEAYKTSYKVNSTIPCPKCNCTCEKVMSSSNFHIHGKGVYNPINPKSCSTKG